MKHTKNIYAIDPDGAGGYSFFAVKCHFRKDTTVTEVSNKFEIEILQNCNALAAQRIGYNWIKTSLYAQRIINTQVVGKSFPQRA